MTGTTPPAVPPAITLDELAEAFDHEIDGCYVGGAEFAVNVFAYVRDHRPAPEPPATATEPRGTVSGEAVAAAIRAVPGYQKQAREAVWLYPSQGQARAMLEAAAPLIAGEAAGRAEAKLAAIADQCREAIDANAGQRVTTVSAAYILGMAEGVGSEEERFAADSGHPSAADREMVARVTRGGIRSREVQPEFSNEEESRER